MTALQKQALEWIWKILEDVEAYQIIDAILKDIPKGQDGSNLQENISKIIQKQVGKPILEARQWIAAILTEE